MGESFGLSWSIANARTETASLLSAIRFVSFFRRWGRNLRLWRWWTVAGRRWVEVFFERTFVDDDTLAFLRYMIHCTILLRINILAYVSQLQDRI